MLNYEKTPQQTAKGISFHREHWDLLEQENEIYFQVNWMGI